MRFHNSLRRSLNEDRILYRINKLYENSLINEEEDEEYLEDMPANVDCTHLRLEQKHINKMKEYFNKMSDPYTLIRTIQDPRKLVSRWLAAKAIGWREAKNAFEKAIMGRGILDRDQIIEYEDTFEHKNKLEKYDTDVDKLRNMDKEFKRIMPSLFSYIRSLHVKYNYRYLGSPVNDYSYKQLQKHDDYTINGHELTVGNAVIQFDLLIIEKPAGVTLSYIYDNKKMTLVAFKKIIETLAE